MVGEEASVSDVPKFSERQRTRRIDLSPASDVEGKRVPCATDSKKRNAFQEGGHELLLRAWRKLEGHVLDTALESSVLTLTTFVKGFTKRAKEKSSYFYVRETLGKSPCSLPVASASA